MDQAFSVHFNFEKRLKTKEFEGKKKKKIKNFRSDFGKIKIQKK